MYINVYIRDYFIIYLVLVHFVVLPQDEPTYPGGNDCPGCSMHHENSLF